VFVEVAVGGIGVLVGVKVYVEVDVLTGVEVRVEVGAGGEVGVRVEVGKDTGVFVLVPAEVIVLVRV
jgi:hypothetical protein